MAFNPYFRYLMEILETNEDMRKTGVGAFKQVAWGATGTIAGAFVGGPLGAMVGGVAGSIIGYAMSDDYESFLKVLWNLSDEEKKELVKRIWKLVGSGTIEALQSFVASKACRSALMDLLLLFGGKSSKGR